MAKNVPLWLVLFLALIAAIGAVMFGAAVRDAAQGNRSYGAVGDAAYRLSQFPALVGRTWGELTRHPLLAEDQHRFPGLSGLAILDSGFKDQGYLLLGRPDPDTGSTVVDLLRIADGAVLHTWAPDIDELNAKREKPFKQAERAIAANPLLMPDGGLVFHSHNTALVKIDACSRLEWMVDGKFHHQVELGPNGHIWTASLMKPSSLGKKPWPFRYYSDDTIAEVSPDGTLLSNTSVSQILLDNGYRGLLLGVGQFDVDAVHLNEVEPAFADGAFWKRGDLLLSLRNRSTVLLYRPSTGKIVWLKTGPWLYQHDPDFLENDRISVFGNDIITTPYARLADRRSHNEKVLVDKINDIYILDLDDDAVRTPYRDGMNRNDIRTKQRGLADILDNGDIFLEESEEGRSLRMTPDGSLRWSYVNRLRDGNLYELHWSRYLAPPDVEKFLALKETLKCDG